MVSFTFKRQVFVNLCIRTIPQYKPDYKSDTYLSHNLKLTGQTVFVVTENLYIVIKTSEKTKPYRRYYHKNKIDIAHTSEQNYRNKNGYDNDNTSHRRYTNFLNTKWIYRSITLYLCYLFAFEILNKFFSEPGRYNKRHYER